MTDVWRKRLKDRIASLGLSNAEVARRCDLGPTIIRDILDRGHTPSIDKAAKIAKAVGWTLQQLWEGEKLVKVHLKVDGVTSGDMGWVDLSERHARVVPLTLFSEDTVSVEISHPDYTGFRQGDVIVGQKVHGHALSNVSGQECIILTVDGVKSVGILLSGTKPNFYNIRPLDLHKAELRDVEIERAAPVSIIVRGQ